MIIFVIKKVSFTHFDVRTVHHSSEDSFHEKLILALIWNECHDLLIFTKSDQPISQRTEKSIFGDVPLDLGRIVEYT